MRLEFMPEVAASEVADVGDCGAIVEEAMVDEAKVDEAISEDAIVDDCISCRVDDLGECCWLGELHFCARSLFKDFNRPATAIGASSDATMLAKIA